MVGGLRAGPGRSHATRSGQTGSAPARRGFSKQPRISPSSWASSLNPGLVAKLVADSAARVRFPQTGRESASSLKPSRNDCLRLRGTVKETGGGPLQTSALPLGYGAEHRYALCGKDFQGPSRFQPLTSSKPLLQRSGTSAEA